MDHDGTGTYSELLHRLHMNQEGSPYRLLTGEQGAPSPHRHMLNGIASKISPEPQSPPLTSWAEYYAARAISEHTPLAMLLSFPLTLYHILQLHQQSHGNDTDFVRNPIRVHYLGPEKELFLLPLFRELAFLMPTSHIEVSMIGPIAFDIPEKPITYEGPHGGTITLTAHRGSYHVLAQEGSLPKGKPDVAVALNAGLGARLRMGADAQPAIEAEDALLLYRLFGVLDGARARQGRRERAQRADDANRLESLSRAVQAADGGRRGGGLPVAVEWVPGGV